MEGAVREAAQSIVSAIEGQADPDILGIVRIVLFGLIAFGTYVIALVNWRNNKYRRTIDLIRSVMIEADMLRRTSRIYSYRRRQQGYPDPYQNRQDISFAHDLICLLNFLDTACIEIKEGLVYEKIVKEHLCEFILESDNLLNDLDSLVPHNVREKYPVLVDTIQKWGNES